MSYTALYRKFRPDHFQEVRGQDHIVTTLKNQIQADRLGHAYLFCGTRGTGKTSIAKLFAKAVNCEAPIEGSPCGKCSSCRTIALGSSMNVIEIDAASNNGVDNIRGIIEEVAYSPAEGRFKVYIIDEVHMLSIGAFNALLKTLEEPPSYVIFILATTEVHKIPITILSRCQRYDFKRISIDTITSRLCELMEKEGIEAEEKALRFVAKVADGSMRDALSLLDQCLAFNFGERLTYEKVLDILGAVDTEIFSKLLRLILAKDISGCIQLLEEMILLGRELTQFVHDFSWYLRNLLLIKVSGDLEEILDFSAENLSRLREEAKETDGETILRYIRIFAELAAQMKYAVQKRILVEIALIKLCRPQMEIQVDALADRIRLLEEKLEQGVVFSAASKHSQSEESKETVKVKEPKTMVKALPEELKQVGVKWQGIIAGAELPLKLHLKKIKPSVGDGNGLLLITEDSLAYDYLSKEDNRAAVLQLIEGYLGKTLELELRYLEENRQFESSYVDLRKVIHMEIEEEKD